MGGALPRGAPRTKGAKKLATSISTCRLAIRMALPPTRRVGPHAAEAVTSELARATRPDVTRLLPWWGKLVHQALGAESDKTEASDERQDQTAAPRAAGVRLHPAIDERPGSRTRRVEAKTVRAR